MNALPRAIVACAVACAGLAAGFLAYRHLGAQRVPALQALDSKGSAPSAPAPEAAPPAPTVPELVPDVRLPDLSGHVQSLRAFIGHPLIVNFWATWCSPCRREMPLLSQLRRSHRAEGLEVVGIALDFRTAVATFVQQRPVDYPLLIGEDTGFSALQQFGIEASGLPVSIFADSRGEIVAVKMGELHPEETDYILHTTHDLDLGRIALPAARAAITERLRELSIERAKAVASPS